MSLSLLFAGPALAVVLGLLASVLGAFRRHARSPWHLAVLAGAPMVVAAAGSVRWQAASGEVDVALGAAAVAVLVCGIFFAGSYALGVLVRALWHAVVRKGKSDAV